MKYNVLIVDDKEKNRKLMASIIKENTNHMITVANTAANVLELFNSPGSYDLPDIILLDILMPEMDGFELARQLKQIPAAEGIPIIFVTALTETEKIVDAFHIGGVDYITKPFKKEELLARLNTHLV